MPRLFPEDAGSAATAHAPGSAAARSRSRHGSCSCSRAWIGRPPKPPDRAELSDIDRAARARAERAERPTNPLPYQPRQQRRSASTRCASRRRAGRGPQPEPADSKPRGEHDAGLVRSSAGLAVAAADAVPRIAVDQSNTNGRATTPGGSLGDALRNLQRYIQNESVRQPGRRRRTVRPEIQFDTKGVEFGPWIRRFIAQVKRNWFIPYAAMSMKGHVVITFNVHKDGSITDLDGRRPVPDRRVQQRRVRRAVGVESDAAAAAGVSVGQGVLHRHVLLQRNARGDADRSSSGSLILLVAFIVYVLVRACRDAAGRRRDPRVRPRPARARWRWRVAERYDGEIINCDSTAVYRGFDIGTDKIAPAERRGIPHHLIDIVDPTDEYTAAQLRARRGSLLVRDIHARGRLPILAGGTGFYYRALTRGLFPGPGATIALRAAARGDRRRARGVDVPAPDAAARRSGVGASHPAARPEAARARAGGLLPDRPSADRALRRHRVAAARRRRRARSALRLPAAQISERVTRRVDEQFARGLLGRDPGAARARRCRRPRGRSAGSCTVRRSSTCTAYATRRRRARSSRRRTGATRAAQLIWFRKEPNLTWFDGPGESRVDHRPRPPVSRHSAGVAPRQ